MKLLSNIFRVYYGVDPEKINVMKNIFLLIHHKYPIYFMQFIQCIYLIFGIFNFA